MVAFKPLSVAAAVFVFGALPASGQYQEPDELALREEEYNSALVAREATLAKIEDELFARALEGQPNYPKGNGKGKGSGGTGGSPGGGSSRPKPKSRRSRLEGQPNYPKGNGKGKGSGGTGGSPGGGSSRPKPKSRRSLQKRLKSRGA